MMPLIILILWIGAFGLHQMADGIHLPGERPNQAASSELAHGDSDEDALFTPQVHLAGFPCWTAGKETATYLGKVGLAQLPNLPPPKTEKFILRMS
jgi:hypothetical protein